MRIDHRHERMASRVRWRVIQADCESWHRGAVGRDYRTVDIVSGEDSLPSRDEPRHSREGSHTAGEHEGSVRALWTERIRVVGEVADEGSVRVRAGSQGGPLPPQRASLQDKQRERAVASRTEARVASMHLPAIGTKRTSSSAICSSSNCRVGLPLRV